MKKVLVVMMAVLAFIFCYPCIFTLVGSFMSNHEIQQYLMGVLGTGTQYAEWSLLPKEPSVQSYIAMLIDSPEVLTMFWNSVKVTGMILLGQACVGIPAAWGLARYHFPFHKVIFMIYVILMVMPFQVMMLAEYLMIKQLGLMDTLWSVILPGIFSSFTVFIIYGSFQKIPEEILEAARIDGGSEWQILWKIGVPTAREGILAALILSFLEYWNLLEQPMTFLQTKSKWPLSLYLSAADTSNMGLNFCVSILALIPAALVFYAGHQYLQDGIEIRDQEVEHNDTH